MVEPADGERAVRACASRRGQHGVAANDEGCAESGALIRGGDERRIAGVRRLLAEHNDPPAGRAVHRPAPAPAPAG